MTLLANATSVLMSGLTALVVAGISAEPIRRVSERLRILDRPGPRSSHVRAVPRTGGLAILLAVAVALVSSLEPSMELAFAVALALILAGVGLVDDIRPLGAAPRLAVHLFVAGGAVAVSGWRITDLGLPFVASDLGPLASAVLPVLFTVAFINFFNFMDGINGLASVQAVLAGALLAFLLSNDAPALAAAAAAIGGGALGFLPHNFPRARVFMGDVGSTTVGAVLALIAIGGGATTEIPFVALCLPFGVFVYDALFTLGRRAWSRENIFVAHREHLYQLLLRSGWSHTRTTALMTLLIGACCAAAVAYARSSDAARAGLLVALFALAAVYTLRVHRCRERPCIPS